MSDPITLKRLVAGLPLLRGMARGLVRGRTLGFCPVCERRALFLETGPWRRDQLLCARCHSIPRHRALMAVLTERFPSWRALAIHESSPNGPVARKLMRECSGYVASQLFGDLPPGASRDGARCEDLERQTFPDGRFDLVITQDVLEHILDPAAALAEIARTLRPGGAHLFTVPWYYWRETQVRAVREGGVVRHLLPPAYHHNPVDANGSLVVTDWGAGLLEFIRSAAGMETEVIHLHDRGRGIDAEFIEVFLSRRR